MRKLALLSERWRDQRKQEDRRAGQIVAIIYNANRDSERDPKGKGWLDVFPEWKEPTAPQTEDEMHETMLAWVQATRGLEPST